MTSLNLSQEFLEKITSSLTTLVEILKEKPVKEETTPAKEETKLEFVKSSMKLFDAINQNNISQLKELLEAGAEINITNQYGETPLHLARSKEQIKLLLETGANPNIQDKFGETPLHWCWNNLEKIRLLLEAGADYTIRNNKGLTPIKKYIKIGVKKNQ